MATALVWGSAGGIGQAITSILLEQGHTVVGVTRLPHAHDHPNYVGLEANFADDYSVSQAVMTAAQQIDAIDLMVYAAGDILSAKVGDLRAPDWRRILDANLTGPYLATHHSLPLLSAEAALVYIGAVQERLRLPGLSAYAAAKAGLEAFVETLTKEERKRKILLARPGAVATPFWDKVPLRLPKDASSPQAVAQKILTAWAEGKVGTFDC